ncbi:hypothetical protein GCM10009834_39960 [Streptomonospora arabica]
MDTGVLGYGRVYRLLWSRLDAPDRWERMRRLFTERCRPASKPRPDDPPPARGRGRARWGPPAYSGGLCTPSRVSPPGASSGALTMLCAA